MKRCPKCNRAETNDALGFCRADGTPLIIDESVSDESTVTRTLPDAQTGEAGTTKVLQTETTQTQATTSTLDAGNISKARTGELTQGRAPLDADAVLSGIKQHKIAASIR